MVQMKIPAETKAIDKYLLLVYLQKEMVKIYLKSHPLVKNHQSSS